MDVKPLVDCFRADNVIICGTKILIRLGPRTEYSTPIRGWFSSLVDSTLWKIRNLDKSPSPCPLNSIHPFPMEHRDSLFLIILSCLQCLLTRGYRRLWVCWVCWVCWVSEISPCWGTETRMRMAWWRCWWHDDPGYWWIHRPYIW